ncbi:hypothetical protein [Saccharopolyspora cebuensis]|uniref:Uncharacterized protein n=1 Tax=Saccharopolyspora cebuensis TaxID=418759 RepID=A0ABV4CN11_9PSEU
MPRIAITGHSNLTPDTAGLVRAALGRELGRYDPGGLVGVTCLARGADQVFARAVLDLGGAVEVVLPAADYRARKVGADNAVEFDALLGAAASVVTLPFPESNRDAYLAASEHVLDSAEAVLAVWDGRPADGRGGTGDVVEAARARGLPVTVVWPEGAERG